MDKAHKEWLTDRFGHQVLFDEPMSGQTTLGIGGPADALLTVETDEQMKDVLLWARKTGLPWMILGAGSNLLVRDGGIRGLVIKLTSRFTTIDPVGQASANGTAEVRAGAGVLLRELARYTLHRGLAGLNFGLGIPGTVGGALRMNAGAWGSCVADTVCSVSFLKPSGKIVSEDKANLRFTYRRLEMEEDCIILQGVFRLQQVDVESLRKDAMEIQKMRACRQPLSLPNAGSIFKNPPGSVSAGELIDQAGLKGCGEGGAEISQKHGNVIVNKGRAKAADVLALISQARARVLDRFGVPLELEVVIVGQDPSS